MNDYLRNAIDKVVRDTAKDILQKAMAAQPVVISCSHQEIYLDEGTDIYFCLFCDQRVYPDPEALKHGYLEYGRYKS